MREYKVLCKGTCPRSELDNFVCVAQYLLVGKNGKKFLLLKLSNDRDEAVTGVKLSIRQRNAAGEKLGSRIVEARVKNGKPHTRFVLTDRIPLDEECADCSVELISADFGAYAYSVRDGALVVSYRGRAEREKKSEEEYLRKTKGKKVSVRSRSVKISVLALAALASLLIAVGITFWNLQIFKENATGFRQAGIEYEFVDISKPKYGPIRVTGYKGNSKRVVIPREIEGYTVVEIAPNAFQHNRGLEEISFLFAGEVQSGAFLGCMNLTKVFFGDVYGIGSAAFANCSRLTEVTARNLEYIGDYAFENCTSLSRIFLSNDAKTVTIGAYAFADCRSLDAVEIDQFIRYPTSCVLFTKGDGIRSLHLKNYNYKSFYYGGSEGQALWTLFGYTQPYRLESLTIDYMDEISPWFCSDLPSLVTVNIGALSSPRIGRDAFRDCHRLVSLNVPAGITEVGEEAFLNTAITSFEGENLQSIGSRAFYGCCNLRYLNIDWNENLTYIGDLAFAGCTSLTELRIPESVSFIGGDALQGCENLQTLTLPFLPNGFLGYIFGASLLYESNGYVPSSLAEVNLTSSLDVADYAFSGCYSLLRVFLNPQVKSIGEYAFSDCSSLEYAALGETLTEIGRAAFVNCRALTSISLPDTLLKIGLGAFSYCDSLEEITLPFVGGSREDNRFFAYLFGAYNYADSYVVPKSLERVVLTDETELPPYAFFDCSSLKEVLVHQGIESIEKSAFSNCWRLVRFTLPSSVKSIGDSAFNGCYRLFEICNYSALDVQKGVINSNGGIGFYALNIYGRAGGGPMTRAKVGEYEFARAEDGWYLFDYRPTEDLFLPERFSHDGETISNYRIPRNFFAYDDEIKNVKLPKAVTYLGDYTFIGCPNLISATFASESSLKEIREGTFSGCGELREVTLPLGVERLGDSAFSFCSSLNSFTIGAAVSEIGKQAFYGCENLYEVYNYSSLNVTKGSEEHGYVAYYALAVLNSPEEEGLREVTVDGLVYKTRRDAWYLIGYTGSAEELTLDSFEYEGKTIDAYTILPKAFSQCGSLVRLNVGKAVTGIDEIAFLNCYNLEEVVFAKESRVTRLERGAFNGCVKLARIELPPTLQAIGKDAFGYCYSLESLVLPQSLREIGDMAFWGCEALKRIYNLSSLPLRAGSEEYGCVAYYAAEILDSPDEGAKTLRAA